MARAGHDRIRPGQGAAAAGPGRVYSTFRSSRSSGELDAAGAWYRPIPGAGAAAGSRDRVAGSTQVRTQTRTRRCEPSFRRPAGSSNWSSPEMRQRGARRFPAHTAPQLGERRQHRRDFRIHPDGSEASRARASGPGIGPRVGPRQRSRQRRVAAEIHVLGVLEHALWRQTSRQLAVRAG